jgi:hypothetical protein
MGTFIVLPDIPFNVLKLSGLNVVINLQLAARTEIEVVSKNFGPKQNLG